MFLFIRLEFLLINLYITTEIGDARSFFKKQPAVSYKNEHVIRFWDSDCFFQVNLCQARALSLEGILSELKSMKKMLGDMMFHVCFSLTNKDHEQIKKSLT